MVSAGEWLRGLLRHRVALVGAVRLREIHRAGVNLNQIARAINMGTLPDTTDDVLAEIRALARAGRLALEHVVSGCRHGA
ncbi:plasmid mobilization relaxosome protein MobC [Streptomyces sp. DvalAA-14]|uniref:plasmid mobilization relaxosome protein MobC n=1 Tax=Streptomyces sp. DvalAA-14 TaxID=1839759 RepID=UPI001371E3F7|nr:plasmid mobilization relaxosome protein MobC [Streptomyces sp. SID4948]